LPGSLSGFIILCYRPNPNPPLRRLPFQFDKPQRLQRCNCNVSLIELGNSIDWEFFAKELGTTYADGVGARDSRFG